MTGMEQEIIKPDVSPKAGSQAFSPLGCIIAATGATLMVFCMMASAMVATVWAFSKLIGLPDMIMYILVAVAFIPVIWVTVWTAGRAWHVEQLLAAHRDIDSPVFNLRHYFAKR